MFRTCHCLDYVSVRIFSNLNSLNTNLALNNLNVSHVNSLKRNAIPLVIPAGLYVKVLCWAPVLKYFGQKMARKKLHDSHDAQFCEGANKVKHNRRISNIGNIRVICIEQHVYSCASTFYWSRIDELHSICQSINIEWSNLVCLHKMHPNNANQHCASIVYLCSFYRFNYFTDLTYEIRHQAAISARKFNWILVSQTFTNILSFGYLISLWNRYFFVRNNQI